MCVSYQDDWSSKLIDCVLGVLIKRVYRCVLIWVYWCVSIGLSLGLSIGLLIGVFSLFCKEALSNVKIPNLWVRTYETHMTSNLGRLLRGFRIEKEFEWETPIIRLTDQPKLHGWNNFLGCKRWTPCRLLSVSLIRIECWRNLLLSSR